MNSGWLTLWTTIFRGGVRVIEARALAHSERHEALLNCLRGFSLFLLVPFLLTHAFPSFVVFPWLPVMIILLMVIVALSSMLLEVFTRKFDDKALPTGSRGLVNGDLHQGLLFLLFLSFQTACHY
jgi:hypothetical protein